MKDNKEQKKDVKVTNFNSVTFISGGRGFEMGYTGEVLWTTPMDSQRTEIYHHDFRRLNSGNYIALGPGPGIRKIPRSFVNGLGSADSIQKRVDFGSVVEFDTEGRKVWEWDASEYFTNNEISKRKMIRPNLEPQVHMNAFYFDEKRGYVYAGFRNMNEIIKVKYPEKMVVAVYNGDVGGNISFQRQHSININSDGNLYIFNNNSGGKGNSLRMHDKDEYGTRDSVATLLILRELPGDSSGYEKVWEFRCDIDSLAPAKVTNGGNFLELPDGNYLVSMGATARVFIVSKQKEILFNAIAEEWNATEGKWLPHRQYRVSFMTSQQLDAIILTSTK